jgi:hypothetical protein
VYPLIVARQQLGKYPLIVHIEIQNDGRDSFNYAVEMGSGAVIYVPSFIKIGSGIQKLIGGWEDMDTHTQTTAT